MKRKGLLFVATLLLSVFSLCLVACSDSNDNTNSDNTPHVHDYKIEKSETMHWLKCDCGDTKEYNVHSGGTATCIEKAVCKECGQSYGDYKEEHSIDSSGFCSVCELPMTATKGLAIEKSTDGTYAQVVGYSGTSTKVNIPSIYDNLPVKTIYKNAFSSTEIVKVIIPDSVISIDDLAFAHCYSLKAIEIPNSVTSIGYGAFNQCTSLTSVILSNSATIIDDYAFIGCAKLYTEENNVRYIKINDNPYYIVQGVVNKTLSTYTINSNAKIIEAEAFIDCETLSSIIIPDSVTKIGDYAFYGCKSLKAIEISNSLTGIGGWAFQNCSSFKSITIPNSLTSIDTNAFYGCSSLTRVDYTGTIDDWVQIEFVDYYSNPLFCANKLYIKDQLVTEVVLTTATKISNHAFVGYTSLTNITIGYNVTSIGKRAFLFCNSLTSITFSDTSTWYRAGNYTNWQNKTGGTKMDVTNPSENVKYLESTYFHFYWYKI